MRKFDANYVIRMLREDLFSEAGKQTLLEYLPFNLAADGDTQNESDGKGNGDSEENRSDRQSEGESSKMPFDEDRSQSEFYLCLMKSVAFCAYLPFCLFSSLSYHATLMKCKLKTGTNLIDLYLKNQKVFL